MNLIIDGYKVEVNIEKLAKLMAFNYVDWEAYMGKAKVIAEFLPQIIKIERELF